MTPRAIVALLLCAALAASHAGALTSSHKPKKPAPKCAALTKTVRMGKSSRTFKLPSCTNATAKAAPTKAAPTTAKAAAVGGVLAAAVATSTAYPCTVGDATCYCTWRAAIGYFADNDPAVACK